MRNQSLKKNVTKLIRQGLTEEAILHSITKNIDDFEQVKEATIRVKEIINSYHPYQFIREVMGSYIVAAPESKKFYLFNLKQKTLKEVSIATLNLVMDTETYSQLIRICPFKYNPRSNEPFQPDGSFNNYVPPDWFFNTFHFGAPIESCELPEVYHDFFSKVTNNDETSYEYLLDWMANSLKNRNFCYLVTIGNQGIGKGIIGQILGLVHGKQNYSQVSGEQFLNSNFNEFLKNKTFLHIDEFKIKRDDDMNKVKIMTEENLLINEKYQNAAIVQNYINVYMSSNSMSSLRLAADDRRFSIINLTNTKMIEWGDRWRDVNKVVNEELKAPENIAKLAAYLYNRPVDQNKMLKPVSSERLLDTRRADFSEWEEYFLSVYCHRNAGREVPIMDVKKDLHMEIDSKIYITYETLVKLRNRVTPLLTAQPDKNFFNIRRKMDTDGAKRYVIEIPTTDKQPSDVLAISGSEMTSE